MKYTTEFILIIKDAMSFLNNLILRSSNIYVILLKRYIYVGNNSYEILLRYRQILNKETRIYIRFDYDGW